jgi:hypothetical protein
MRPVEFLGGRAQKTSAQANRALDRPYHLIERILAGLHVPVNAKQRRAS